MVGLQGRVHPVLNYVQRPGRARRDRPPAILQPRLLPIQLGTPPAANPKPIGRDRENGATGLTIPGGHSLDTLAACLGGFRELAALLDTQHKETEIIGTGKTVKVTSADQVLVNGKLQNGAVASVHIKADMAVPAGVRLEINGAEGDLLVRSETPPGRDPVGLQRAELVVTMAKRGAPQLGHARPARRLQPRAARRPCRRAFLHRAAAGRA